MKESEMFRANKILEANKKRIDTKQKSEFGDTIVYHITIEDLHLEVHREKNNGQLFEMANYNFNDAENLLGYLHTFLTSKLT